MTINRERRHPQQTGSTIERQSLMPAPAVNVPAAAEFTTFGEFFSVILRNKWTFGLFLLGGAVLAALLALSQTPTYDAKAQLEVEMPNEDFLNRRQLNPVAEPGMILLEPFLQTQVKLIESDTMLLSIIDKLDLVRHREFNQNPGLLSRLKHLVTHSAAETRSRRAVLAMVRKHLTVRLFGQTQIVEIEYEAADPQLAADLVNSLAEGYRGETLKRMVGTTTETQDLLAGQIEEQKRSLTDAENSLREFVSRNGLLVANNDKESFADDQMRQVQTALGVAHEARVAAQSQYELVRTASPEALGKLLDSDTLKSYRVKLAELQQQLAENSEVLKPAHYKVRQIQAEIDSLQHDFEQERAGILARLKSQYEAAQFREESLTRDYKAQARTVSTQMGKSIQFNELKRDLDTRRTLYDSTLQKAKEAGVVSAMQVTNVHIVDPAVAAEAPIRPNKMLYSAIGVSAGSLFGLVFIFAAERRNSGKQIPALSAKVEQSVRQIGSIPMIEAPLEIGQALVSSEDPRAALGPAGGSLELAVWRDLNFAAESFRKLLPHLLYSSLRTARPRVITVTSATHGEGKTFVACNLATALAQSGRKVLLVDGDRIHPRVHEVFGVDNESGFSDLILHQPGRAGGAASDTVWSTRVENLFVSPAGRGMARLATLAHDPRVPAVLDRLCCHFDMILIDTPPVFAEGDAVALGLQSDGVLLVVRSPGSHHHGPAGLSDAAVDQCLKQGLPLIGKILNGQDVQLKDVHLERPQLEELAS